MGDHNAKAFTHGGPNKAYLNTDKPQSILWFPKQETSEHALKNLFPNSQML